MTKPRKVLLIGFALFAVALNIVLYIWNQSLRASEVPYLENTPVYRVAFDGQGQVWVSGGRKLIVYRDGIPVQVFTEKDSPLIGTKLSGLEVDNKGRVWILQSNPKYYEISGELAVYDGMKWSTLLQGDHGITSITIDGQGRAWIGTEEQGLYVIDGEKQENYTSDNSSLLGDTVTFIGFDQQERAWIGTWGKTAGTYLNIYDGEMWQSFTIENTRNYLVRHGAIAFDLQGQAWIAAQGLYIFDGKNFKKVPESGDHSFWDIGVDNQGRVWAMRVFDNGIVVFDGPTKKYYYDPFHMPVANPPIMLATDGDKNIWILPGNGVVIMPPDSPQPLSYAAVILSSVITTSGLIYLTILLFVAWLCIATNAWRSIGFSLLGFPIYLGWIILNNNPAPDYSVFHKLDSYFYFNPGVIGTIAGIIGGYVDILLARSGTAKRIRWGLVGLVIWAGLSFCFGLLMMIPD